MKAPLPIGPLTAALTLSVGTLLVTALLPARPVIAQQLPPLPVQFDPNTVANPGLPGGRRRSDCPAKGTLSAIAFSNSQSNTNQETVGTLTTRSEPTLWFYLPTPISNETDTQFIVKNEQNITLYEGQLSGETDRDGIVQVPLGTELAVGDRTQWFLTLNCEGDPTTVNGWVSRQAINPALSRPFAEASDRNRAALYASEGFLQDAISELAMLRLTDTEDDATNQDWARLLRDLDLIELTAMPLLECCTMAEQADEQTGSEPEALEPEALEPEALEPEAAKPVESEELEDSEWETESPAAETNREEEEEEEEAEDSDTRTILQRARDKG